MTCPDENTLGQWQENLLEGSDRDAVERHLDECGECHGLLAIVARHSATARGSAAADETPPADPVRGELGLQPGRVIDAKYRIDGIVGRGGMGVVVRAQHLALQQRVALKVIKPELLRDPVALMRFTREARLSCRLSGPHVARVFDLGGVERGEPYIAMEYLEGEDLGKYLASSGPVPVTRAIAWLRQACEGVAEAHDLGLVHRDLKPSNLFLASSSRIGHGDDSRVLKVLDFGISKTVDGVALADPALTESGATVGSPLFAAPEQLLSSRNVDRRADVWALGVVAYQLLTGQLPFAPGPLPEVVARVLRASPTPLHVLRPELPPALVRIVERCLDEDPSQRFDDARQLGAALAALGAEPETPAGTPRARVVAITLAGVVALAAAIAALVALERAPAPTTDPTDRQPLVQPTNAAANPGELVDAGRAPPAAAAPETLDAGGRAPATVSSPRAAPRPSARRPLARRRLDAGPAPAPISPDALLDPR
jgi:serine/threonine-protein kinase